MYNAKLANTECHQNEFRFLCSVIRSLVAVLNVHLNTKREQTNQLAWCAGPHNSLCDHSLHRFTKTFMCISTEEWFPPTGLETFYSAVPGIRGFPCYLPHFPTEYKSTPEQQLVANWAHNPSAAAQIYKHLAKAHFKTWLDYTVLNLF